MKYSFLLITNRYIFLCVYGTNQLVSIILFTLWFILTISFESVAESLVANRNVDTVSDGATKTSCKFWIFKGHSSMNSPKEFEPNVLNTVWTYKCFCHLEILQFMKIRDYVPFFSFQFITSVCSEPILSTLKCKVAYLVILSFFLNKFLKKRTRLSCS